MVKELDGIFYAALDKRYYSSDGTVSIRIKIYPTDNASLLLTAISINAASEIWENVYMSERPRKEKIYLRARRHDVWGSPSLPHASSLLTITEIGNPIVNIAYGERKDATHTHGRSGADVTTIASVISAISDAAIGGSHSALDL